MADDEPADARALRRIADVLGVSIACFFDGDPRPERAEAGECLRLWHRLRTEAERDAALDALRRIVDVAGA